MDIKEELQKVLSLNGETLKEEFEKIKNIVLDNLKISLNESKDSDLNKTISKTIEKIKESSASEKYSIESSSSRL